MALKARTRGWLDVASRDAVDALRGELDRLTGEVGALRSRCEEGEARQARDVESLRDELRALANRFDAQAGRVYATADDLAEVARRIDDRDTRIDGSESDIEQVRIRLAGLAEQVRWESDDIRKALTAIIERVEGGRRTA